MPFRLFSPMPSSSEEAPSLGRAGGHVSCQGILFMIPEALCAGVRPFFEA